MKKIIVYTCCALFIIAITTTFALTKFKNRFSKEQETLYIDNRGCFSTSEGFYYINQERFLQFFDYKAEQNTVVCNKPNCEHNAWSEETPSEQRCNAFIDYGQSLFVYNAKLYSVETDPKKRTLRIIKSDLDRSSQSILAELNSEYIGSYLIKEGKLYFSTLSSELEKDEGGMPVQTGISFVTMCSLDMNTGKIEELYTMDQHYNAQLSILGIFKNQIYCFYSYFDKKFTGFNYEEAKKRLSWHVYDIAAGKMQTAFAELSDIDINLCILADSNLFYGKWADRDNEVSDIFCYDLINNKNHKIISDSFDFCNFDQKIIACNPDATQYMVYDIASKNMKKIQSQGQEVSILAEYKDDFIVASYQNGTVTYGHTKKSDFYSGKANFHALS